MTLVEIIGNQQVSIHTQEEQIKALTVRLISLTEAVKNVYYAGKWALPFESTTVTVEEQEKLFETLRAAVNIPKIKPAEKAADENMGPQTD